MPRSRPLVRLAALLLGASASAALAAAEDRNAPDAPLDDEEGWHVIRPGETLEGLSIRYLGDAQGWKELYRLNPRILDPHWIFPGRKVRVPLTKPAQPVARVTALSRDVEERPAPVPWRPADTGDLLLEQDGLRTQEDSSAQLRFDDGSTATISENSLVFIRRQRIAQEPVPKREIEIELGQAEIAARSSPSRPAPEIEVIVGGTRATSRPAEKGALRSRHRLADDAAEVMVYEGTGRMANAAGTVELAAGTGTSARGDAAPRPAERLLPAPEVVSPPDGFEFRPGQPLPEFRWSAIPDANGYVVELCQDAACSRLLERAAVSSGTAHRPGLRPDGLVYWRVTAVAASGLDGFPARARRLRPRLLISFE